jgi:hypothetical protein
MGSTHGRDVLSQPGTEVEREVRVDLLDEASDDLAPIVQRSVDHRRQPSPSIARKASEVP